MGRLSAIFGTKKRSCNSEKNANATEMDLMPSRGEHDGDPEENDDGFLNDEDAAAPGKTVLGTEIKLIKVIRERVLNGGVASGQEEQGREHDRYS
jgi:hypothetical protein